MKKTFLFCIMVIALILMPHNAHAQSFLKQLGKDYFNLKGGVVIQFKDTQF